MPSWLYSNQQERSREEEFWPVDLLVRNLSWSAKWHNNCNSGDIPSRINDGSVAWKLIGLQPTAPPKKKKKRDMGTGCRSGATRNRSKTNNRTTTTTHPTRSRRREERGGGKKNTINTKWLYLLGCRFLSLSLCASRGGGTALPTAEEMDEIISIIWRVVTGVGGERMEENEEERRRRRRVMTSNPIAPAADASHPALYNVTWLPLVSLLLEQAGTRKNVPVVAFLSLSCRSTGDPSNLSATGV